MDFQAELDLANENLAELNQQIKMRTAQARISRFSHGDKSSDYVELETLRKQKMVLCNEIITLSKIVNGESIHNSPFSNNSYRIG